jgi:TonB family protein
MTNKALLYRPRSQWQIVIAFTVAAGIHLSAVAIASLRHEVPSFRPQSEFTPVDIIDPATELPASVPIETPLLSAPTLSFSEFIEPEPPRLIPKKLPAMAPVRSQQFGRVMPASMAKSFVLNAPRPEYPYEARSRRLTGSGIAVIMVDPANGSVADVILEQSLGSPILDSSAISAFRRWRFKTGTVSKVRIPITFTLTGASY